jgi:hypothetical protein
LARWIVAALALYSGIGFVFALAFVSRGAGAIDPAAKHSGWAFRILILPGSAALWPLLAKRWWLP